MRSEDITKVLYPNDEVIQGKNLRLQQQFSFVSCSLQDMIRVHQLLKRPLGKFHEKWVVQLYDKHPAIAVAELMRLLVDEHAKAERAAATLPVVVASCQNPHATIVPFANAHRVFCTRIAKHCMPLLAQILGVAVSRGSRETR